MSLRKSISASFTKPCITFYRVVGALAVEFGDGKLKTLGKAALDPKVHNAIKTICHSGYAPALSAIEYAHNKQQMTEFTHVLEHAVARANKQSRM